MKALQLQSVGNLELVETSTPVPGDDELLVRTEAAVICTSDLHDIRSNPFNIKLPVIMGHEASGVVEAVGAEVADFRPGDRVATHPVHPCYRCGACKSGFSHLCENMGHFAFNRQGTFAEFFPVRQDRARKIPSRLDPAVAALAEPVAVCIEALDQARLKPGERVLIMGDGPFGVLIARLALQRGDLQVVLSGHHDWRLAFAEGAIQVNTKVADDPITALREAGGGGFDAVFVGVSRSEAYDRALALLRPRGVPTTAASSPPTVAPPAPEPTITTSAYSIFGLISTTSLSRKDTQIRGNHHRESGTSPRDLPDRTSP